MSLVKSRDSQPYIMSSEWVVYLWVIVNLICCWRHRNSDLSQGSFKSFVPTRDQFTPNAPTLTTIGVAHNILKPHVLGREPKDSTPQVQREYLLLRCHKIALLKSNYPPVQGRGILLLTNRILGIFQCKRLSWNRPIGLRTSIQWSPGGMQLQQLLLRLHPCCR